MYNISNVFRNEIENDNRNYSLRLVFTFSDNSTLTVTNSGIWSGGLSFEDAVSGDNEFQIGSAIVNKMSVVLNNINDDYSDYDFEDATVVAYIGINLQSGPSEEYRRGTYIVSSATGQNTSLIKLECLDYMHKLDKAYALVNTTYPATVQTIVQNICTACGITLLTTTFYNGTYVVQQRPDSDGLSCRQVIAFAAQIACSWARCDEYGRLAFQWYGSADTPQHTFTSIYNISTSRFTVTVTGLRVTEEFPETETAKKQEYLYGQEGYVLDVSGNDLIQDGSAETVAEAVGARVLDMSFKTVDATIASDPSVEAGDTATIIDEKGNETFFYVTSVTFVTDGSMTIRCSAKSPVSNATTQYTETTRALIKARETAAVQIKQYDLAVQQLTTLMSESFGLFKTEQVQQDGSTIYILHNKPTLQESAVQWKMTAGALAVSDDYGQTWRAGIDAQGNAVVNVLSAIGVSADWIRTGVLEVSSPGGQPLFIADYNNNSVYISGDYVYIGDETATEAISQLAGALTVSLSNESQGIPVDYDGDYSTFPDVSTRIRVMYGGTDVTMTCQLTYSEFNITGVLTSSGTYYTYTPQSLDADTGYVTFTAQYNTGTETVQNSKRFNLYKVYAGQPGPAGTGEDASIYFIEPNTDIIKQGANDEYIPPSITFNAYYRTGSTTTRYAYTGLFQVEETTDGTTWTIVEYPTVNKTSTTYTPSSNNIAAVRCTLFSAGDIQTTYYGLAGGDTTSYIADNDDAMLYMAQDDVIISGGEQLDIQTAAVVKDISSLSQDDLYNILTNDGEWDILTYIEGRLFINASYIGTGILRSPDGATYWNLRTGEILLSPSAKVGTSDQNETLSSIQGKITANTNEIAAEITARTNQGSDLSSRISLTESAITQEVTDRQNADSSLSTRITQTSNSITQEVTDRQSADNSLSSRITQNANAITLRVTSAQAKDIADTEITAKADEIRLKTGKLIWSATNSSLTEDGTFSAKNGNFRGNIILGGSNNVNGSLDIKHSNGESLITGDQNGLKVACQTTGSSARGFEVGYYYSASQPDAQSVKVRVSGDAIYFLRYNNAITGQIQAYNSSSKTSPVAVIMSSSAQLSLQASTALTLQGGSGVSVSSNFSVASGYSKSKVVDTEDYGKRALYCYEMATPVFGDIGEGVISEDGYCYIQIDPVFSESINTLQYQVFLQRYGNGDCYVKNRCGTYFIVAGTPGLEFGWEIKAKQADIDQLRLEKDNGMADRVGSDYAQMATEHINTISQERNGVA